MKVGLVSLGCARTLVDSEVALGGLKKEGHEVVADIQKADVVLVNTCGFIEEAKIESIEAILRLCQLKKKGRLKAVVVLGCLAQRYGAQLRKELGDEVDAIIGTDSLDKLAELLRPLEVHHKKVFEVNAHPRFLLNENTPRVSLTPDHFAYVKISEGCLNACSYCVIPRMKGPHRSRTIESIVNEIKQISTRRRLSEINLIGQDTAAFGFDRGRLFQLPELLKQITSLNLAPWIRLLYAHPGHIDETLMDVMASGHGLCKYLDLPIEHSHDRVLERMNRGVTRAQMEWVIARFRKKVPGVSIRTAVIVGFPGETDEEFRDLMNFLKAIRFERLGAFMFSEEEGSKAYGLPGQIPIELKKERF
ncbi:MAG: 30S ribosomal protein S12 methylthiotransferase RimO, partial [Candidatus Omnitrophica bacterium CG07_land_8_20_14_0_80_50_8]